MARISLGVERAPQHSIFVVTHIVMSMSANYTNTHGAYYVAIVRASGSGISIRCATGALDGIAMCMNKLAFDRPWFKLRVLLIRFDQRIRTPELFAALIQLTRIVRW